MSTQFRPLQIPPGVVAMPTKKMSSSNWAEVNLVRWREGQLTPIGGQAQFSNIVDVNLSATTAFTTATTQIGLASNPGSIRPGMTVTDMTLNPPNGTPIGTAQSVGPGTAALAARAAFATGYYGIAMTPNPGWVVAGMGVTDLTNAQVLGTVQSYQPFTLAAQAGANWNAGDTSFTTHALSAAPLGIIPGLTVVDQNRSAQSMGVVASVSGATVHMTAPIPFSSVTSGDQLIFSSGTDHVLLLNAVIPHASAGAADTLQFGGSAPWLLTLTAPAAAASSGSTDALRIVGEGYSFQSRCKRIHGWYDNNPGGAVYHIAYLCEQHLYVDTGGALIDITPAGGLIAATGLVGGFGDGLYMNPPPPDDLYGTPRSLPSSVAITKVPDAYSLDNFGSILYAMTSADGRLLMWDPNVGGAAIIQPPSSAANLATTAAFTTSSPNITMVAQPGSVTPGMSVYDKTTNLPVGTVQTYTGTALVLTANAQNPGAAGDVLAFAWGGPVPHGRCFVITQERFLMIFGSTQDGTAGGGGSSRRLAWCDQENPGAWDYSNVTSQAGFLDIEPASPIICADASRTGVIFWTAKKVYASRFLGLPYVYNATELADATTPWSPQSVVTTSALTLWMSEQGVFSYDGTSVLPVACPIRPWIDDGIDPVAVRELSFAMHLGEWNEWWWFFPTLNSPFNTRAAVYNYKEGWWTECRLSRSAGITSSYTSHPICADDLVAFQHEVGSAYANASMPVVLPFAESYDLNLTSGARLITVKQLMPDVEAVDADDDASIAAAISNLRYSMFYRNSRSVGAPELQAFGRGPPDRMDGYVDFRVTGRDLRLRIDVADATIRPFTLGQHLIDAVPRGDR
jgi:hypothetical protein